MAQEVENIIGQGIFEMNTAALIKNFTQHLKDAIATVVAYLTELSYVHSIEPHKIKPTD